MRLRNVPTSFGEIRAPEGYYLQAGQEADRVGDGTLDYVTANCKRCEDRQGEQRCVAVCLGDIEGFYRVIRLHERRWHPTLRDQLDCAERDLDALRARLSHLSEQVQGIRERYLRESGWISVACGDWWYHPHHYPQHLTMTDAITTQKAREEA